MLPSRFRLSRQAIAKISSSSRPKRAISEHFSAVLLPASDIGEYGCAVIVSKKVAKTSVGRHLLKRRVRATLREWCQERYALILYARPGSAMLTHADITNELNTLLPRVGASRTM